MSFLRNTVLVVIAVIVLLVIIGIVASSTNDSEDALSLSTEAVPSPSPTKEPILTVNPSELLTIREENEARFKLQWVGKTVIVTGIVSAVELPRSNIYDVTLHATAEAFSVPRDVVCKMNESAALAANILQMKVDDPATIRGVITDDGIIDLVLEPCVVDSFDQSPVVAPTETPTPHNTPLMTLTTPTEIFAAALAWGTGIRPQRRFDLAFVDEVVEITDVTSNAEAERAWGDEVTISDIHFVCTELLRAGQSGQGVTALDELLWDVFAEREVAILGALMAGVYEDEIQLEIYCTDQLRGQ